MAENIFETKASRANKQFSEVTLPLIDEITKDWSNEDFQALVVEALSDIPNGGLRYFLKQLMIEAIIRNEPIIIVEAATKAAHSHNLVKEEIERREAKAGFQNDLDQIQKL